MQKTSSKNSIIIIIVIVILAGAAYFYYSGTPNASSTSSLTTTGGTNVTGFANSNQDVGAQVLSLLNEIHQIKIDTSFFASPAYQSLVDHTVVVPEQNVGRPNPFVPVPGAFVSSAPVVVSVTPPASAPTKAPAVKK